MSVEKTPLSSVPSKSILASLALCAVTSTFAFAQLAFGQKDTNVRTASSTSDRHAFTLGLLFLAIVRPAYAQRAPFPIPDPDPEVERKSFILADGFEEIELVTARSVCSCKFASLKDCAGRDAWLSS